MKQIGLSFDICESGIDEDEHACSSPEQYVQVLAQKKAEAVGKSTANAFVVGADTIVVLDEQILGKPVDQKDAERMLRLLSARTHTVYTGIAILDCPSNRIQSSYESTKVTFRSITDVEIAEYVASGSPMDKAGAYGIQDDYGAVFVERIEGCYYNVVGFPLAKFYVMLQQFQQQLEEDRLLGE